MSVLRSSLLQLSSIQALQLPCLFHVSCQSLSAVGRRRARSFWLHRSLPVDICRIFLALPPCIFSSCSLFGVRAINVHTSAYTTCVCPAHLLFLREILHMPSSSQEAVQLFLRSTVPPFNCSTVQLLNCPAVQLFNCPTCRALSGMEEQELRLPLLSRRRQRLNCFTCFTGITCIFRSISSLSSRGTQTCHRQTERETE